MESNTESKAVCISGISTLVTGDVVYKLLAFLGDIASMVLYNSSKFGAATSTLEALVEFSNPESIKLARKLSGIALGPTCLYITCNNLSTMESILHTTRTVYISNIPAEWSEHKLVKFLVDNIGKVVFMKNHGRYVWIEFASNDLARSAFHRFFKKSSSPPFFVCLAKDSFCNHVSASLVSSESRKRVYESE
jgi:hypothetical protein